MENKFEAISVISTGESVDSLFRSDEIDFQDFYASQPNSKVNPFLPTIEFVDSGAQSTFHALEQGHAFANAELREKQAILERATNKLLSVVPRNSQSPEWQYLAWLQQSAESGYFSVMDLKAITELQLCNF